MGQHHPKPLEGSTQSELVLPLLDSAHTKNSKYTFPSLVDQSWYLTLVANSSTQKIHRSSIRRFHRRGMKFFLLTARAEH